MNLFSRNRTRVGTIVSWNSCCIHASKTSVLGQKRPVRVIYIFCIALSLFFWAGYQTVLPLYSFLSPRTTSLKLAGNSPGRVKNEYNTHFTPALALFTELSGVHVCYTGQWARRRKNQDFYNEVYMQLFLDIIIIRIYYINHPIEKKGSVTVSNHRPC